MIQFPDSMSRDDISSAMRKMYPPKAPINVATGSISPTSPSFLDRTRDMVRNSAVGYALQSGMPKVASALGLQPTDTTSNPEQAQHRQQLLSPSELISPNQDPTIGGVAKSVVRGGLKGAGSLTTPENMALMGAGISHPLASVYFGAQMVEGGYTGMKNAYGLAKQGRYNEAAEEFGEAALSLGMAHQTARHLDAQVNPRGAPAPDVTPVSGQEAIKAAEPSKLPTSNKDYADLKARVEEAEKRNALRKEPVTPPPVAKPEAPVTPPPKRVGGKPKPSVKPPVTPEAEVPLPISRVPAERVFARASELRIQGLSEPEQVFHLTKEFPQYADQIAEAYGKRVSQAPGMGQPEQATAASESAAKPISLAQATPRSGEPLPAAAKSQVDYTGPERRETPRLAPLQGAELVKAIEARKPVQTPFDVTEGAQATIERDLKARGLGAPGAEPRLERGVEKLSANESDLAKNLGLGPQSGRMDIYDAMVRNFQKKGMAKGTAEFKARKAMEDARGSLSFKGPDDPGSRREAKIRLWIDMVRNPATRPEVLDRAYKNLQSYGIEGDELIKRIAGATEFAKGIDKASQESLEERTAGYPKPGEREADTRSDWVKDFDKKFDDLVDKSAKLESALHKGDKDMPGVKSPAVEELERMIARPDNRPEDVGRIRAYLQNLTTETEALVEGRRRGAKDIKGVKLDADRSGERGSLSLKPISDEERKASNPFLHLANLLDRLLPDKPETQAAAENIIRDKAAQLARKELMADAKFKDAVSAHDNDGKTEFRAFMDAGEGKPGAEFLTPTDQALATELHSMFQDRWAKIVEIKGFENHDGIDNYLSHLWERPKDAKGLLPRLYSKRPLEGKAGFLRQRVYDYASEGLDAGLKPITFNPIRMQMAALHQLNKYIMAHDIKDTYKDAGLVKWFGLGDFKDRPSNWTKLNDKIFQPKRMEGNALSEYGTYFAPPEVAKVFNRYLEPGLRGKPTYEVIRGYSNRLNQAQLGLSAYHGTFITIMSGISDVALGVEKVVNNRDMGGFKDIFRGSLGTFIARSAAMDYKLGRDIQAQAISPGVHPELDHFVRGLEVMGARFEQDPMYMNKGGQKFFTALKNGKIGEALDSGIAKLNPIMTKWVPRIKLGMAARMMEAKMDYLDKQGINDPMTTRNELAKIWDSVDNRAGQMVYDNLFWNKMAKDLSFLSVRAVGWDFGSFREGLGGLRDTAKQSAKLMRGEKAQLTSRMAFTIATPIVVGMLGGMTHYLATGKAPQKPEDYFYPATGKTHPDGSPERLSWPSYMKDYFGFTHNMPKSIVSTLLNKLHPSIQSATQLYENSDFYGTEIITPGDPLYKQGYQFLKFAVKQYEPFGIQGIMRRHDAGESWGSAATAIFGVMPAPAYIGQTKAEQLSFEISNRKWQRGPKDSGQADIHQNFLKLQQDMDNHKLTGTELTNALHSGAITTNEIKRLFDQEKMTRLERNFTDLSLPEAIKVYSIATPEERAHVKMAFVGKLDQLSNLPEPEQKAYAEKFKALMK